MRIDVVSLFPEFVAQVAGHGVVGRAIENGTGGGIDDIEGSRHGHLGIFLCNQSTAPVLQ